MAKKNHVHKYYKSGPEHSKLWACALPDCFHHMPKHYEHMLPGKASVCWGCKQAFSLSIIAMESEKPVCDECRIESGTGMPLAEFENLVNSVMSKSKIESLDINNEGPKVRTIKTIPEPDKPVVKDEVIDYSADIEKPKSE